MKKTCVTIIEGKGADELAGSTRTALVDCANFKELSDLDATIENAFKYERTLVLLNSESVCVEEVFRVFKTASNALIDTVLLCTDSTFLPTLCIRSYAISNEMNYKLIKKKKTTQ